MNASVTGPDSWARRAVGDAPQVNKPSARAVVAIDGPSGSGKSTVSREVARRLGMAYLDTGAMYRAVAAAVLRDGLDPADAHAVAATARGLKLIVGTDPDDLGVQLDGVDVTDQIRGPEVTAAVSAVSAVPEVREMLVREQRAAVAGATHGIVVEGRDIGTVVLPEAPVKVFLVADQSVRAHRRAQQDRAGGRSLTGPDRVRSEISRRDAADSGRSVSPLRPARDAVTVDATSLSVDEVVSRVLALVDAAMGRS